MTLVFKQNSILFWGVFTLATLIATVIDMHTLGTSPAEIIQGIVPTPQFVVFGK
jgi:hypothetical protein